MSKLKLFCKTILDHYSAIIISVIPVIIVNSLLGAVINIFSEIPIASGKTLAAVYPVLQRWSELLTVINNCGTLLIPVYVTWATVRHFQGTELYAIFVGLTLVPPELISGLSFSSAIADGSAVYWNFGFLRVPQAGFQGQILVAIIAGLFIVMLERRISKRIPKTFHIFIVPFVCVVLTSLFIYLVAGPAARGIEQKLTAVFTYLLNEPEYKNISGFILGLCHLPMMLLGLHLALMPINIQQVMSTNRSPLWPITVTSVLSAGGAALAVLIYGRDKELHEKAREGTMITLGLGTVEPALFGVCARNRNAMLGAVASAALSGLICRVLNINSTSFGLNGFMSFLNLPMELWDEYAIAIACSILGGFLFTVLLLKLTDHSSKAIED